MRLLSRYDVFLLDEPTNDLDFAGLKRLEQFVLGLQAGLVVVSHDREFLSRTISSVLDRDEPTRTATLYNGGYDAYLAERELRRSQARDPYEDYADKRQGLVVQAQRQREQSVRRALRSRPTTSTSRPSSSWSRRSRRTTGRCCWSPTTGGCPAPSTSTGRCGSTPGGSRWPDRIRP